VGVTTIRASIGGISRAATITVTNPVITVGDFRTRQSGTWTNRTAASGTWERWNGSSWVNGFHPTNTAAGNITIRDGHTVTITAPVTNDQVTVATGGRVVVNNVTWTVANGAGTDLTVHGTLRVAGNSGNVAPTGTISFESGGIYEHARLTGSIPTAAWNTNSTCSLMLTNISSGAWGVLGTSQTFGNISILTSGGSGSGWLLTNISCVGNFTLTNGSSRHAILANSSAARTLTIGGDFVMGAGTLDLSSSSGSGSIRVGGNFVHSSGAITETGSGTGHVVFTGTAPQSYTGGGGMTNNVHFSVNSGATLLMGTNLVGLGSSGNFTNQAGGTLGVGHPQGIVSSGTSGNIRVTGVRTNNAAGNYIYNGVTAQVPGNGLPATVNNLTIANPAGVTINSTHVVNGTCKVTSDGLLLGNGNINGPIVFNGTVSPGTSVGTLSTGPQSWYGGGSYIWELSNATGTAGSGYDRINAGANPIAINASSANKFRLKLVTLNGSSPGMAANFNLNSNYVWTIASGGSLQGFDTNKFEIDASAFQNPIGSGTFSLEQSGGDLRLRFSFVADELAVATAALPAGDVDVPYTATLAASGGVPPYQWAIVGGSLPPGFGIQTGSGSITGTVATAGTYSFTTQVTDADSPPQIATRSFDLVIAPPPPILVVTNGTNAFTSYYAEILRTEGLNSFTLRDVSSVTPATLAKHDVLILGQMTLTATQVTTISNWVVGGGNLIAMRPDKKLAGLLGLTDAGTTLSQGYLRVNTTNGPGKGIVAETIQYHGAADRYTLNTATSLATLYSTASNATVNPAVTVRSVGGNGGQAAAFTFDLARSVVYTRQGNPAWVGDERDGIAPLRSSDLFYGNKAGDPQPDWIDLNKVAIPQADEQQRLLANMIISMNTDRRLLPRFWYFPHGHRAAVVMTGDDHSWGGTAGRFDQYISYSTPGGSVDDWETIRSTSYIWTNTPLTDAQASAYDAAGFEIGLHLDTGCANYTAASLNALFTNQLTRWKAQFPNLPAPTTHRMHCIVWSGYTTLPEVGLEHGIRLDTSYYYWPSSWVADRPGLFTGSGMVMRFATTNGVTLDVFQANTQMTDESGQTYPFTSDTLLDRALGPEGYYGFFVANMHTDFNTPPYTTWSDAIIQSAQSRGVPVISSRQLLTWLDSKNDSSVKSIQWTNDTLSFSVVAHSAARGLQLMAPVPTGYTVAALTLNGSATNYVFQTVKGVLYAVFTAANGDYQIQYVPDTTPPVVDSVTPVENAGGVSTSASVNVKFSEAMDVFRITTNTFSLRNASNAIVAATVAYNESDYTATLTPGAPLAIGTRYTATVKGGTEGVLDVAGNPLDSDFVWSFDVVPGVERTLGNTNNGNSSDVIWFEGPWINAFRVQANTNLTLTALHAKVGGVAGKYKCAVYAGNATQPLGLLGQSEEVSSPTTDWRTFPLNAAVVVTNGQYYWLAVWSDDPNATIYYTDTLGTVRWEPYAYGPWPNPIDTTSGGNFTYCMYASGYVAPAIESISVTPTNSLLMVGGSKQFTATATYSNGITQNISGQATWVSTNISAATINPGGLAQGLAIGTTRISATLGGVTGSTMLTVTVSNAAVSL
ncbi:MAG TPA: Ig-like domain-containing protein, partial [Verrucomicrobiota bacterium]|nr:Ig-like domain-containing protein [Verrucomicrobiota bacterium]